MKNILVIDKTPPALERSFRAATKFEGELPTDLEMESIPLEGFHPWLKIFMLKYKKHRKILTFTCENF